MDDSPTFRHAMVNLGISRDDMRKKNLEDFGDAMEKDLVQVRYKHYQERLLNLVNCLLQERHRIKNQAYIAMGGTAEVTPRYQSQTTKLPSFMFQSVQAQSPGGDEESPKEVRPPKKASLNATITKRESFLMNVGALAMSSPGNPFLPKLDGATTLTAPLYQGTTRGRAQFLSASPNPTQELTLERDASVNSLFLLTQLHTEAQERAERERDRHHDKAVRLLEAE